MHKQKATKLGLRKLLFPKVTKRQSIRWLQNRLYWGRGSERPAAHIQQNLTQVTSISPRRALLVSPTSLSFRALQRSNWILDRMVVEVKGKLKKPSGEDPLRVKKTTNNKIDPHMTSLPGFELRLQR